MSNLFSVKAACSSVGLNAIITSDHEEILKAEAIILPGVGAFKEAMDKIKFLKLDQIILKFVDKGKLVFGICLGMQLLFDYSLEFGENKGMGLIGGSVLNFKFEDNKNLVKIPHLGWNRVNQIKRNGLFAGINNNNYMYFVHSFYVSPTNHYNVISTTNYGGKIFCSSIQEENIIAVQFHPEKSGADGIKMYNYIKQNI